MDVLLKYLQLFDTAVIMGVVFVAGRIYQKIQVIEDLMEKDSTQQIDLTQQVDLTRHDERIITLFHRLEALEKDYAKFKRECVRERVKVHEGQDSTS